MIDLSKREDELVAKEYRRGGLECLSEGLDDHHVHVLIRGTRVFGIT